MATTPSITIVKRFLYRGNIEEWSNSYHFSGGAPIDNPGWLALGTAIWNQEKRAIATSCKVVQYYGYLPGQVASVAQIDRRLEPEADRAGGLAVSGSEALAGDQVVMVRALVGNSVKGKKVYIRKYYHASAQSTVELDKVSGVLADTLTNIGLKLTDGTLPGGVKWCGPNGAVATQPQGSPWVTTRTLKRRSKRPLGSP
jgi:hypothetical protein